MIFTFIFGFTLFLNPQQELEVPYLSLDSFEYVLDYSFKNKPIPEKNTVYLEREPVHKLHPLPYVKMTFSIDGNKYNYFRYKIIDNFQNKVKSSKIKGLEEINLDLGFAADIKDRITAYSYSIIFYDESKTPQSKIVINFSEDGDMFINENLLGKI
ncbi:MAG TPA: hypothetical protein PKL31_14900 [Fulvivirga sp.]|nr:hypothetical protein [Fulvivirga sp.]